MTLRCATKCCGDDEHAFGMVKQLAAREGLVGGFERGGGGLMRLCGWQGDLGAGKRVATIDSGFGRAVFVEEDI